MSNTNPNQTNKRQTKQAQPAPTDDDSNALFFTGISSDTEPGKRRPRKTKDPSYAPKSKTTPEQPRSASVGRAVGRPPKNKKSDTPNTVSSDGSVDSISVAPKPKRKYTKRNQNPPKIVSTTENASCCSNISDIIPSQNQMVIDYQMAAIVAIQQQQQQVPLSHNMPPPKVNQIQNINSNPPNPIILTPSLSTSTPTISRIQKTHSQPLPLGNINNSNVQNPINVPSNSCTIPQQGIQFQSTSNANAVSSTISLNNNNNNNNNNSINNNNNINNNNTSFILNQIKPLNATTGYREPSLRLLPEILREFPAESLDLLFRLFDLPIESIPPNNRVDFFLDFAQRNLINIQSNTTNFLMFIIVQIQKKTVLYQDLLKPKIPIIFQPMENQLPFFKFAPLCKKPFDVPVLSNPDLEYAIIAKIVPQNSSPNGMPIFVNDIQTLTSSFGDVTESKCYLISKMQKNHPRNINVKLIPKHIGTLSWLVFYYVAPSPIETIESQLEIPSSLKGVKTDKCGPTCLFHLNDAISKLHSFGLSICPTCKSPICLRNLVAVSAQRPNPYFDVLSSQLATDTESEVIPMYDYFSTEVDKDLIARVMAAEPPKKEGRITPEQALKNMEEALRRNGH